MAEFQYLKGGNSEVQDMQAEAYLYASSGTVGIAATGVIDGLVVTQALTANGTVLIGTGACINQASLGQGGSRLINPSQKTLDIFTANPMGGLPRNDIVVFDSITATIIALIGTPNATPTDPTVPNTAVALARLRNLASATTIPTAQIDNLIVATTLRGLLARAVVTQSTATMGPGFTTQVTVITAPAVVGDGVKRFKITGKSANTTFTVAGDVFDFKLLCDGTVIANYRKTIVTGSDGGVPPLIVSDVPAAGSHTYTMSLGRVSGTGTATITPSTITGDKIEIIVEQIA